MSEIENTKPFCFVLMPFNEEFNDIYELGIKQSCSDAGAYCERVDEQIFDYSILERIYNQISKADIIIADLTDKNPNVFYEVGYAHAIKRPTILITKNVSDIPFDLKHFPHIIHNNKIIKLKDELTTKIKYYIENRVGKFSYPSSGEYGINILDRNTDRYAVGTYSMNAIIPNNQKLTVKISGTHWYFPVFQSIPGWRFFDCEINGDITSRKFQTIKSDIVDFNIDIKSGAKIEISVYENETPTPTWEKTIIVEN